MRYRKRNPDGSFGGWVYTPAGEEESRQLELETNEEMQKVLAEQKELIELIRQEIEALRSQ